MELKHGDNSALDLESGLRVFTASAFSITFTCSYPVDVTVTSDKYTVNSASSSGTTSGTGNLADGFSLGLHNDSGFAIGNYIEVTATWTVTALPDVSFYFHECGLIHGDATVNVIQDRVVNLRIRAYPEK